MIAAKSLRRIDSARKSSAATLTQRAHHELRAALLRGDFLPGTALTLRALAERLGTSVMPVREAVSRLAAEQALELQPNRAIVVPELGRREIDELWRIRWLIEGDAAALAAEVATPEDIDSLVEVTAEMWQAVRDGDARTFVKDTGIWAMHLAKASHSSPFMGYISNVRLRCAPHIAQAFGGRVSADDPFFRFSLQLQEQITDAIRDRDGDRARDLRAADVRTFQSFIYKRLGWV
ncbi:DNA-binding transcriptional regulator, GntR family [Enhydrobacter aerosaccus]|uniref:DNA-binding transcriptional regulator, GntR family n=1 Tax=Enhydrobacter aerosaccus TaxID=225324 RepID=A0A1T4JKU5_9HYPH|nr:GntR family transcriptional regulator [Enhydrobacter aerosaccus]SJZ30785.1 DNA-binding transcriptional regulator, GntR family [Enhydrobacter aerosaccus]